MAKKGTFYRDISNEFKIALLNYSIWERNGEPMSQKEFEPAANPSLVNNIVSGRAQSKSVRKKVIKFTQKWYWKFNKKTEEADE